MDCLSHRYGIYGLRHVTFFLTANQNHNIARSSPIIIRTSPATFGLL